MRFSVWPSFERPWDELVAFARHVEQQGWDGLWYADHYMPNTPDGAPADGYALECWSVLAGLAAAVPRLRLGSLVSPTTVHHPALLANRAATIDQMSGGRLVLGIGAGWQVNEHAAYGFELFEPKDRVDRFAEAIEIVRRLLRDERTTLEGRHFRVVDAPCDPKPVQDPLPILVGTGSPRMMRLTARFADEWNTWGTPAGVRDRMAALDAACEAEGRDPATVARCAQALVFLSDDESFLEKVRANAPADRSIIGTPAQLAEVVADYAAAGLDELIVPDFTMGSTPETRRDAFDRFLAEVAAPFR